MLLGGVWWILCGSQAEGIRNRAAARQTARWMGEVGWKWRFAAREAEDVKRGLLVVCDLPRGG
jgi:hypothetical protein